MIQAIVDFKNIYSTTSSMALMLHGANSIHLLDETIYFRGLL